MCALNANKNVTGVVEVSEMDPQSFRTRSGKGRENDKGETAANRTWQKSWASIVENKSMNVVCRKRDGKESCGGHGREENSARINLPIKGDARVMQSKSPNIGEQREHHIGEKSLSDPNSIRNGEISLFIDGNKTKKQIKKERLKRLMEEASKSRADAVTGRRWCKGCGKAFESLVKLAQHISDSHGGKNSDSWNIYEKKTEDLVGSNYLLSDAIFVGKYRPDGSSSEFAKKESFGYGRPTENPEEHKPETQRNQQGKINKTKTTTNHCLNKNRTTFTAKIPEPPEGVHCKRKKKPSKLKRMYRCSEALIAVEHWKCVLSLIEENILSAQESLEHPSPSRFSWDSNLTLNTNEHLEYLLRVHSMARDNLVKAQLNLYPRGNINQHVSISKQNFEESDSSSNSKLLAPPNENDHSQKDRVNSGEDRSRFEEQGNNLSITREFKDPVSDRHSIKEIVDESTEHLYSNRHDCLDDVPGPNAACSSSSEIRQPVLAEGTKWMKHAVNSEEGKQFSDGLDYSESNRAFETSPKAAGTSFPLRNKSMVKSSNLQTEESGQESDTDCSSSESFALGWNNTLETWAKAAGADKPGLDILKLSQSQDIQSGVTITKHDACDSKICRTGLDKEDNMDRVENSSERKKKPTTHRPFREINDFCSPHEESNNSRKMSLLEVRGSHLQEWLENTIINTNPINKFEDNDDLGDDRRERNAFARQAGLSYRKQRCHICGVSPTGPLAWKEHVNSKRHIQRALQLSMEDPFKYGFNIEKEILELDDMPSASVSMLAVPPKPRHSCYVGENSSAFSYVDHMITEDLNKAVVSLLQQLMSWQERTRIKDPMNFQRKRRLLSGMREVRKALRNGKAKALIVAPNVRSIQSHAPESILDDNKQKMMRNQSGEICHNETSALGTQNQSEIVAGGDVEKYSPIEDLLDIAAMNNVPVVFALSRQRLGRVLGSNKKASLFAIINAEGAEITLKNILVMVEDLRRVNKVRGKNNEA